jgi:hypothetical protein
LAEEKREPLAAGRKFLVTNKVAFERHFLEHAQSFRKDFILFVIFGAFLCVATYLGVGVLLYLALIVFLWWWLPVADYPNWPTFGSPAYWLGYTAIFLFFGYAQYRRQLANRGDDEIEELFSEPRIWEFLLLGREGPWVMLLLCSFPTLPFLFLREVFSTRGVFTTQEVHELACEIIAATDNRVPEAFLRERLRANPRLLRKALALLLQMKFLIARRNPDGLHFLRTLTCEEFLETARGVSIAA